MPAHDSAHPSDEELLTAVAAGDQEAFGVLFRRRHADVYRFALHMTASRAAAEDVTQEAFLTLMGEADRFTPERGTVAAWLFGIARNHVRRRLERERPMQPLDSGRATGADDATLDWPAPDGDPLHHMVQAEQIDLLRRAVLSLPIRYREAVVLCDLQELSYADAAALLDCAVGTVRSRLHRGRALLASKLRDVHGSGLKLARTRCFA